MSKLLSAWSGPESQVQLCDLDLGPPLELVAALKAVVDVPTDQCLASGVGKRAKDRKLIQNQYPSLYVQCAVTIFWSQTRMKTFNYTFPSRVRGGDPFRFARGSIRTRTRRMDCNR